jgi:hypothetical protein
LGNAGGLVRIGEHQPVVRRTYDVSRLCIRSETSRRRGSPSTLRVVHGACLQPGSVPHRQSTAWLSSLCRSASHTAQRATLGVSIVLCRHNPTSESYYVLRTSSYVPKPHPAYIRRTQQGQPTASAAAAISSRSAWRAFFVAPSNIFPIVAPMKRVILPLGFAPNSIDTTHAVSPVGIIAITVR